MYINTCKSKSHINLKVIKRCRVQINLEIINEYKNKKVEECK